MGVDSLYWMNYSIQVAEQCSDTSLKAAMLLISEENRLICSTYKNEVHHTDYISAALTQLTTQNIRQVHSIFLTINSLDANGFFPLSEFLDHISVNEIYIGLPDPALCAYMNTDPVLSYSNIHRYPIELQRRILHQNSKQYSECTQNIKHSPYYSQRRISKFMLESLAERNYKISWDDIKNNKEKTQLAHLLAGKYSISYDDAVALVASLLSKAFDDKYSSYNYADDLRSIDSDWINKFSSIYNNVSTGSMEFLSVIDVGVGTGHEAISLFHNCKNITFVDIAQGGLKNICQHLPTVKTVLGSAEDLHMFSDNSFDLYISLRTYNSSFFNVVQALQEAFRIMRPQATIILSVANGFLCPDYDCILPGLIIPGEKFVDLYRGIDTAKEIVLLLRTLEFQNINIHPVTTEIYITANKP